MRFIGWNINQRSSNRIGAIPPFVAKEIMLQEPEFFILTELGKPTETDLKDSVIYKILSTKYFIEINSEKIIGQKILIGISKKLVNYNKECIVHIDDEFDDSSSSEKYPNYLHVDVILGNITLSIIGVRIRIGNGEREDYICRKVQLENLLLHIKNQQLENVIIIGDFNNSRIMADMSKTYNEVKHLYRYNSKGNESVLYDTYNYHIFKDKFANEDFAISTPSKDSQFSFFKNNYGYKLDHILSKGLNTTELTYSWDFVHRNHEHYYENKENQFNYSPNPPLPDHAMIISSIITTTYICTKCGRKILEMGEFSIPPSCEDCID